MIGRITPAGQITEYPLLSSSCAPEDITAGPDGNLWFTESNLSHIGRITTSGILSDFSVGSTTNFITTGPDGNLWYSETNVPYQNVGTITPTGTATSLLSHGLNFLSARLTAGPDGNIWFTQAGANVLGRLAVTQGTYAGDLDNTTNFLVPTSNSMPGDITVGPDNNLWFTESGTDKVGSLPAPQAGAAQDYFQATEASNGSGPVALILDASSVPPSNFTASINWGDASTSPGTISGNAPIFTLTGSHTYLKANDYPVSVQVVDTQDALTMIVYTGIHVSDAPLASAAAQNLTAVQGSPINKVIGSFTDADPNGIASNYFISVIWPGDWPPLYHTCTDCLVLQTDTGLFNISSSHVFTASGNLPFSMQVGDMNSVSPNQTSTQFQGNVAVQPPPGFAVSASAPSPASVSAGGSATSTITISPITGYSGSVTLACSSITLNGLAPIDPPVCAFNPTAVTSASGNSVLTVSTKAPASSRLRPDGRGSSLFYATWLLLISITVQTRFRTHKNRFLGIVLVCVMLPGLIQLLGCGGGNNSGTHGIGGTPTGNYKIVVTASANGVITQNVTLTLTVQ
jgi:hypothetical protein